MKQVYILLLLLTLIPIGIFGQDSIPHSSFRFGLLLTPDYGYRTLKPGSDDVWMKDLYDTLEVPAVGYSAGMIVQFEFNKRVTVISGLQFCDRGETTRYLSRERIQKYRNHLYYLSIPVQTNYYLVNKHVRFFVNAGLSVDIFLAARTRILSRYSTESEIVKPTSDISRLGLSLLAGAGLDCPLTETWTFRLLPVYRRSLTSVNTSPLKKYYYSAGLSIGFLGEF